LWKKSRARIGCDVELEAIGSFQRLVRKAAGVPIDWRADAVVARETATLRRA
jgi:hypothetical protein